MFVDPARWPPINLGSDSFLQNQREARTLKLILRKDPRMHRVPRICLCNCSACHLWSTTKEIFVSNSISYSISVSDHNMFKQNASRQVPPRKAGEFRTRKRSRKARSKQRLLASVTAPSVPGRCAERTRVTPRSLLAGSRTPTRLARAASERAYYSPPPPSRRA